MMYWIFFVNKLWQIIDVDISRLLIVLGILEFFMKTKTESDMHGNFVGGLSVTTRAGEFAGVGKRSTGKKITNFLITMRKFTTKITIIQFTNG